jgi:HK97 family phage portal protein
VFERIAKLFRTKQSAATRAIVAWMSNGQAVWTPVDYANLSREGYAQNVIVYRAVEYVAAACAGIEWCLYNKYQRSQREIEQHPLLELLARPNDRQSGTDLMHALVAYRLLSGNGYLERVGPGKDGLGAPRELYTHRPDRLTVLPGNAINPIAGWQYRANGLDITFKPEQIMHWKSFNPLNDWYGMSPIEAAARSVDQNNESRRWNTALLQNAARPSGGLFFEADLSDQQFDEIEGRLQ